MARWIQAWSTVLLICRDFFPGENVFQSLDGAVTYSILLFRQHSYVCAVFIACSTCRNLGCFQLWTRKWGCKLKNIVCCFNIGQPGNNLASPQGLAWRCILLFLNIFGFCSHSHVCLQYQSHVKLCLWYKIGFYIKLLQSFLMSLQNRMVSLRCIGRYHTATIRSAGSPSLVSSISGEDNKIQSVRVLHSFHSSVTVKGQHKVPPDSGIVLIQAWVNLSASLLGLFSGLNLVECLNLVLQLVWSWAVLAVNRAGGQKPKSSKCYFESGFLCRASTQAKSLCPICDQLPI